MNFLFGFCLCALALNVLVECRRIKPNEVKDGDAEYPIRKTILSTSVKSFAYGMFRKLSVERPEENVLTSPVSAYAALMMLHLAAEGHTTTDLDKVLFINGKDVDYELYHETFGSILREVQHNKSWIPEDSHGPETIVANGFFVQKDRPIRDSYVKLLSKYYDANATNVDFSQHAQEATNAINSWIFEKTKNRIENFYSEPLSSETISVLTSALYFHGFWHDHFSKEYTQVGKFDAGDHKYEVPMMRNQKMVAYSYSDNLQVEAIKLQYEGGEYYMKIVLPYHSQTLKNLTRYVHLLGEELQVNTKVVGVDYKIPKMKFSWKNSLVDALGLENVFRHADLGRMTTAGKVPISDMLQATEIEVTEEGTIASAVTGISGTRLLSAPVSTEKHFYVDRPFYVAIVHKPTQMTLFQANVYKPYYKHD